MAPIENRCYGAKLAADRSLGDRSDEDRSRVGEPQEEISDAMKKIEAIIKPFKLDEVKEALQEAGI
jgi:hypothetical protein